MEEFYKPTEGSVIRFLPDQDLSWQHIAKKYYAKIVVWDEKEIMQSKRRKKLERILNEDPFGLIQKQPICYVDENGKCIKFNYE